MLTLLSNIKQLIQIQSKDNIKSLIKGKAMRSMPLLTDAYLIIENSRIFAFGEMKNLPALQYDKIIDCTNKLVMPTWVDSHTHLVHAQYREQEFVDRINGLSYEEIAQKGGGILNSAAKLKHATEQELFESAFERLKNAIQLGTGAIEIKSGYGLTVESELKMLRVIQQLKEKSPIPIKASFLGAHAFPLEFKNNHEGYIDLIIHKMLPQIATEGLADYIDVFCEQGFFSVDETNRILEAGSKYNLKAKIHANQLHKSGGVQVGVKNKALSVDHLESMGNEEIACLKNSTTIPVLLPGAAFFLNMHYQPARAMLDAELPIVLASDYNPGSCPSYNMNFIVSLACTQMKMTPQEAIHASTINAAFALELEHEVGSITEGMLANLIITKPISSFNFIPYWFGQSCIEKVIINGE